MRARVSVRGRRGECAYLRELPPRRTHRAARSGADRGRRQKTRDAAAAITITIAIALAGAQEC